MAMTRMWAAMLAGIVASACERSQTPKPRAEQPAPQQAAAPIAAPAPLVPENEPPLQLPAGQTLGDALPQVPALPRRLASGAAAGALVPQTSCADLLPADCALGKRLEITLPAEKAGEPPLVGEVCLCTKAVERADTDRARATGKQLVAVAAWPGERKADATFPEAKHEPAELPPERQKAGHDGAAWGTLIATGWPQMPAIAVASARFADGAFGEVVHWQRTAQALHVDGGKLSWQPLTDRRFYSYDVNQLRAVCDGTADAAPADRVGANLAACERAGQLPQIMEHGAAARLALREKRLNGQNADSDNNDPDPQAIWLRDAKKQLKNGHWQEAIETALRVDVICGDAVEDAHAIVTRALAEGHVVPAKVAPNQPLTELCEPLPDKPAPKRQRADPEKPAKAEKAAKADAADADAEAVKPVKHAKKRRSGHRQP